MASDLSNARKAWSVLIVSTLAFTVLDDVWRVQHHDQENAEPLRDRVRPAAGTPVLTGLLIRVPLKFWTDGFGGRIVMAPLTVISV